MWRAAKLAAAPPPAQPPHREIQKTALGATDSMNWEHRDSIVEVISELKASGKKICSIEQTEKTTLLQKLYIKWEKLNELSTD